MNEVIGPDEIMAVAERAFGDPETAKLWLNRPKHRFGELSPFEMLSKQGGAERFIEMLGQIKHGIFA